MFESEHLTKDDIPLGTRCQTCNKVLHSHNTAKYDFIGVRRISGIYCDDCDIEQKKQEAFFLDVRDEIPTLTRKKLEKIIKLLHQTFIYSRDENKEDTLFAIWLAFVKWEQNKETRLRLWDLGCLCLDCPLCIYYRRSLTTQLLSGKKANETFHCDKCGLNCESVNSGWHFANAPGLNSKYQLVAELERKLLDACLNYKGDKTRFLHRIRNI